MFIDKIYGAFFSNTLREIYDNSQVEIIQERGLMRIKRRKAKLTLDQFILGLIISLAAFFSLLELAKDIS